MTPDPLTQLDFVRHPECLARLLDAAGDGVFSVDAVGTLMAWSGGAERITGFAASEVVGRDLSVLDGRDCTGFGSLRALLESPRNGVVRQECHVTTKSGERLHLEGVIQVHDDGEGRVLGALGVFRDRTTFFGGQQVTPTAPTEERCALLGMVGKSRVMQEVFRRIRLAAASDVTTLVTGESGTGKELCAQAIHRLSRRDGAPFAAINCSAIPETLLESELFGHARGAFTGAATEREGLFQSAKGGTVFLDEIGDISPLMQVKLLRVLQERRVRPVGDSTERTIDLRVVAATNRDLKERIEEGVFREDFYYRIRVFEIALPPLRERPEDLPLLADAFLQELSTSSGKRVLGLTDDALDLLERHRWPGNVRELRNVIEHGLVMVQGDRITPLDLPEDLRRTRRPGAIAVPGEPLTASQLTERASIVANLEACEWNRTQAAKLLGYSRVTLWKKMRRFRIDEGIFRRG